MHSVKPVKQRKRSEQVSAGGGLFGMQEGLKPRIMKYGDRSSRNTRCQTNKRQTAMTRETQCEVENKRSWDKNDSDGRAWSEPAHED